MNSRAARSHQRKSKARATSNIILAHRPTRSFDGNTVHLSLTANPSHLEIVDPVVLGKVRAEAGSIE
jgi:2-oxoglutarate dehydrogenase complex dehydrogenase (E1) component-like enzyme